MKRFEGTEFVKEIPKDAGLIVAMCTHKDVVYIASQKAIFYLSPKKRLMRCKFQEVSDEETHS